MTFTRLGIARDHQFVVVAIERLRRAGLVARAGSRGTAIDDPLLAQYLQAQRSPPV